MNSTTTTQANFIICTLQRPKYQVVIRSPSDEFILSQIAQICVNGVLILLTVLLNGVAIGTILKCSQLNNKLCYFLVLVQSFADLFVGVLGLPLFMLVLASDVKGDANCTVVMSLALHGPHLTAGFSMVTLSALNFERYLGILHPAVHRTKLTKKKLLSFVLCAGVLHIATVPMFFIYTIVRRVILASVIPLFLVTTTYFYIRIFLVAIKRTSTRNPPNEIATERGYTSTMSMNRKKVNLTEIKLAKSCFMIVLLFVFSFLPISIVNIFFADQLDTEKLRIVQSWCVTIAMLNSSLNSVIFFWTRRMLRKEAKKFLKRYALFFLDKL